jgi:carboxylate-amine ligase
VIEIKTNGPAADLTKVLPLFQNDIHKINTILSEKQAKLLPTGAHPFMDPHRETKLWPHESNEIYDCYNEIFNCQGHGWSNLQSMHVNLPFANDEEFTRLHTAIRLLMPIMPAMAASTPVIEGKLTGFLDTRLEYYRKNQEKIPAITGNVIPEWITSMQDYEQRILQPMYKAISAYDKNAILQNEWLNSRGAIARFDRGAIEIRVLDTQECVMADLAIAAFIVTILKSLVNEEWSSREKQATLPDAYLSTLFLKTVQKGGEITIDNETYLDIFGLEKTTATVTEVMKHLYEKCKINGLIDPIWQHPLEIILSQGNLAQRICRAMQGDINPTRIQQCYQQLSVCLQEGTMFQPGVNPY